MAENDNAQVVVEIVLDDGSIQKGFVKIAQEGQKTAGVLERAFNIRSFVDLAAAIAVASKAFNVFKNAVADGIGEAIEGEQAALKLASAIQSVPGATAASVTEFQKFSDQLSKLVAVDDDVINANAALLASLGRLSGQGLQDATKAALDFAAGTGVSVETAFKRLALAAEGNVAGLQKIGLQFRQGSTDAEKFQAAIQQIGNRFGGLAESQAVNTFGGLVNSLKVAFNDTTQALGELITKSPAIRELLKFIVDAFRQATDAIKLFGTSGGFDRLLVQLVQVGSSINTYLIVPFEIFFNGISVGFAFVQTIIQGSIAIWGTLGEAIATALGYLGIENQFTTAVKEFGEASRVAAVESVTAFAEIKSVFETPVSDVIGSSIDTLSTKLKNLKPVITDLKATVDSGTKEMSDDFFKLQDSINKAYQNGVVKTLSTGAQMIGKALAGGGASFEDFSKAVLNIMGDLAIQIGTMIVAADKAITALKLSVVGAPGVGIAAGLALIAVGGLLKTFGGASVGGVSNPSSDGTSGSFNPGVDIPGIDETAKERATNQGLVVNVQGDILGDEASGKRLVDLMNAAFDAGGVSLRRGLA